MENHRSLCRNFVLAALTAIIILPATSWAQPRGMRMPDSSQIAANFDSLALRIALADSQKSKVRDIYFASFDETRKLMASGSGDFRAMMQDRRKIVEKRDNDIKALLSDDQKKAYDKYIEEERAQMRSRMGQRRRPGN
ncbi:MAG: hypothetical protein H6695_02180 [Deferribacteres bacterium]|nr:hypothetical protein [candidate division KSB1 bacterium]MCB9508955.1 hypothetical protein [Deferribacteres bacterium]